MCFFSLLQLLYDDSRMVTLEAPYVAGFLAFRETPFLLEALQRLKKNQPALLPQVWTHKPVLHRKHVPDLINVLLT